MSPLVDIFQQFKSYIWGYCVYWNKYHHEARKHSPNDCGFLCTLELLLRISYTYHR